jgi:MIP family channel proteins
MKKFQAYFAETLGTFTLVFVGCASVLIATVVQGFGVLGVALAHGLALMMIVYTLGSISGAHVNPAVTFGMWVSGKMSTGEALKYVFSQLVGAVLAALLVKLFFVGSVAAKLGALTVVKQIDLWQALLLEAICTFFLVWSVFSTMDKKFPAAMNGLVVGLTLTMSILVIGVLTGGALNPARAFGPALVSGFWENHLIYWAGPLLGALLAAGANWLFGRK